MLAICHEACTLSDRVSFIFAVALIVTKSQNFVLSTTADFCAVSVTILPCS
jgi:hypothetical protein